MHGGSRILGVGAYIPEEIRTNDWWPKEWVAAWTSKQKGLLNRLSDAGKAKEDFVHPLLQEALKKIEGDPFTGLKERRVAPAEMLPSDMELISAREAIKNAGLSPQDIDLVMTYSAPTDHIQHMTAPRVHHELGCTRAVAFGVHAVCFSINVMMNIAHQFISAGIYKHALLVTSCKFSNVLDYTTGMSVQSGDGSAGMVMGPGEVGQGVLQSVQRSETEFHDAMFVVRRHESLAPRAPYAFGPSQNQSRFIFGANNPALAARLVSRVPYWAEEAGKAALEKTGWKGSDVDLLISNAATVWYAPMVAQVLGIKPEAVEENTLRYGNMAGTNLPMNLYTAWKKGRLQRGTKVLFFGHGAGASFGATTFVW